MKCVICSFEIPEGKKCCPHCGRIITDAERKKAAENQARFGSANSPVYRPASTPNADNYKKMPDLFNNAPDAPEYVDPHSYDRITADVIRYDKMFVTKTENPESPDYSFQREERPEAPRRRVPEPVYPAEEEEEPAYGIYEEPDESPEEEIEAPRARERNDRPAKTKKNPLPVLIAFVVLVGLVVIVAGGYQVGKQLGLWGTSSPSAASQDSREDTSGKKAAEPSSEKNTAPTAAAQSPAGYYTVTSSDTKKAFLYKSSAADYMFASIPNGTVIEITEIETNGNGKEMGKTTYNSYTGWISLSDVVYSPNAAPEEKTTAAPESTTEASESPNEPGLYTVTMNGDGNSVNVRTDHSTAGEIITELSEGTQVTVDEVQSGWGHVTVNGEEGWIYMKYLR